MLTLNKPQYPNTNSADWSPYISLKNWLRGFVCWSKLFPSGDHFIDSHNIISKLSIDDVERKLTLVTLGSWRVNLLCFSGQIMVHLIHGGTQVSLAQDLIQAQQGHMAVLTAHTQEIAWYVVYLNWVRSLVFAFSLKMGWFLDWF